MKRHKGDIWLRIDQLLAPIGSYRVILPLRMFEAVAFTMVVSLAWYRYFSKLHQKLVSYSYIPDFID